MLFQEMAATLGGEQEVIVDNLTQGNNILKEIEVFEANHALQHKYGIVSDVVGGSMRDLDDAPATLKVDTDLGSDDLQVVGGKIFVSEDKVIALSGGNLAKYIDGRFPRIIMKTGNSIEKSLIYDVYASAAIAAENVESIKGAGDDNFSILAVRFVDEECGLAINAASTSAAKLLALEALNGGNKHSNAQGITGWEFELKTMLGAIVANPTRMTAAIVNIDASNVPTKLQINNMIESVYPDDGGKTVLMMSPFMRNILEDKYGETVMRTSSKTNDVGQMITQWYDTPIITSRQFAQGVEPFVTLP